MSADYITMTIPKQKRIALSPMMRRRKNSSDGARTIGTY